jgi:hypothetical protein
MTAKNLDVRGTSQHAENASVKEVKDNRGRLAHFNSLCAPAAQTDQRQTRPRRHYRVGGTRYITDLQASNIIQAVRLAKSLGLPLVAHLTIHWACADIGDDPDAKLFAKFREGLSKWTRRHGFDLTATWARERMSGGQAEAIHCHLLFYLPREYRSGAKLPTRIGHLSVDQTLRNELLGRSSSEASNPRQAALSRWQVPH